MLGLVCVIVIFLVIWFINGLWFVILWDCEWLVSGVLFGKMIRLVDEWEGGWREWVWDEEWFGEGNGGRGGRWESVEEIYIVLD